MFVESRPDLGGAATATTRRRSAESREAAPGLEAELTALPLERIEQEISALASHINAATCRWLILVAEFERRRGHERWGFHSCAAWLSWHCGIARRPAQEQVRVARALGEFDAVREAFSLGQLSYSKVRALTRVVDEGNESELVEFARHATASQLERVVRGYRGALSVDDANAAHARRGLSCSWDEDGSLVVRGRLAPEEGALMMRALDAAHEELRQEDRDERKAADEDRATDESRTITNVDALVRVAEASLAGKQAGGSGGDRNQIVIHLDAAALQAKRDADPSALCKLEDGPSIAGETARRLACDASLVPFREAEGSGLSVGRKTRTIPPAMRRALRARDGGCRFPGCGNRFTDGHHLHHWADGGETSLDNLAELCRRHHRLVHEEGFTVERRRGGLIFRRPDGRAIREAPVPPRGWAGNVAGGHRRPGPQIAADACVPISRGERLDYAMALEGLLARSVAGSYG